VAELTAVIAKPKISYWLTEVVQPVNVVECSAVPVEIAGAAEATMELVDVGIAVPVATFQTPQVIVPVSTVALHPLIVQANGTAM